MNYAIPAPVSPKARVYRTVFQVIVAVLVAVPAAVVLLPVSAGVASAVVGFAGAATVIVSAIQNALNARGI